MKATLIEYSKTALTALRHVALLLAAGIGYGTGIGIGLILATKLLIL